MYLLDTNVCIDFVLGRGATLRDRMQANARRGLSMSAITYAELAVGARQSTDPDDERRLDTLVSVIGVREFDRAAARVFGSVVREVGVRRKSFDRLIGAHALALDLTLITNNERDFADIPGLRIENWSI